LTPITGWYWINPDFVWNGDRLAFVKEYYREVNGGQVGQQSSQLIALGLEK
jgi:hypothetical protein